MHGGRRSLDPLLREWPPQHAMALGGLRTIIRTLIASQLRSCPRRIRKQQPGQQFDMNLSTNRKRGDQGPETTNDHHKP